MSNGANMSFGNVLRICRDGQEPQNPFPWPYNGIVISMVDDVEEALVDPHALLAYL